MGTLSTGSLVLALASLAGCSRGATVADEGPILVGVVMPQTGSLGPDGQEWLDGIKVATQEINAAGGALPGRPIELVIHDSRTDATTAVAEATTAVFEEGVVAIIGDGGSGGTLAIYDNVTRMEGVPQVSCCATSPALTAAAAEDELAERMFFRTAPSDALQGKVVARIGNDHGCTRMTVLHLDDAYGTPFAEAIEAEFTRLGGTVAADVVFDDSLASYTTQMTAVAESSPECVAVIGYPADVGTMLRDYARISGAPTPFWIGTDSLRTDNFVREADPSLLATIDFYGAAPVTRPASPEFATFSERYRATFSGEPAPFVPNNYDAAALLYLAIAKAGTTSGRAIMQEVRALASTTGAQVGPGELARALAEIRAGNPIAYTGASGPVDVDEFGDVRADYEIWQVSDDGSALESTGIVLAETL